MKIIMQQDETDCGVACMSMILKYYKSEIPLHKLRDLSGTDLSGTSILGIKKALEDFKINSKVIRADELVWEEEINYPIMAHIIKKNGDLHYVIVEKKKNNMLYILDPSEGKIKKSIKEFNNNWTGIVLIPTLENNYEPINEKSKNIKPYLTMLNQNKKIIFTVIFLSLLVTFIGIIGSYYIQVITDIIIPNNNLSLLNIISLSLITLYVFNSFLNFIHNYLLVFLGQKMNKQIMLRYINHIFKLPMSFFSSRKTGEIISRLLDASKIIDALSNTIISIFIDISMLLVIGSFLLIQNKLLFLITMFSVPLYILIIFGFVNIYEKGNQNEMRAGSELNSNIIESLEGIETIKSYNGEKFVYSRIENKLEEYISKSLFMVNTDNVQQGIKQFINLLFTVLILWIGTFYVLEEQLSLGELLTYNALMVFFTSSLQNIINLQVKIQSAKVANARLNEIMDIKAEEEDNKLISDSIFEDNINFNNLYFSYNMKPNILKNINMCILKHDKVAITGISGSGKSTLLKLLVRFYEPTQGNISFGNTDLKNISYKQLRKNITYVPQETFFFSGTIIENLVFGIEKKPTIEEITKVCDSIKILDFINEQPLKFNTILEEGGNNLSGGQKQRLSLARAILSDSKILILDEVTSGFDNMLESQIINYLVNLENKTIIFITHHLSVSKYCDKVFVIDEGTIKQEGTHEYLKNVDGVYKELFLAQKI